MLSTIGSVASQGGVKKIIHFDFDSSIAYDKASNTNWTLSPSAEWWNLVTGKFGNAWKMELFYSGTSGILYKDEAMAEASSREFTIDMWVKHKDTHIEKHIWQCDELLIHFGYETFAILIQGEYSPSFSFVLNDWGFLRIAVSTTKISIIYNGSLKYERMLSTPIKTTGTCAFSNHQDITIDEFRVRVGICDISTSIPTTPFE